MEEHCPCDGRMPYRRDRRGEETLLAEVRRGGTLAFTVDRGSAGVQSHCLSGAASAFLAFVPMNVGERCWRCLRPSLPPLLREPERYLAAAR